ncbi:hypothetical protein FQN54_003745 [Arachnomyces sp. PD_36]|nr:hypothetical protein FQN54_003745 [Arachnomyces sp. PD_36]
MKTVLALGALAALFPSAFALTQGTYTIGSASLAKNQVLSKYTDVDHLFFDQMNDLRLQTWNFLPRDDLNEFVIQNGDYQDYINCGAELGSLCTTGDKQEVYIVEQVENGYEFVSKESGYFLRVDGENLRVSEWNSSPEQTLVLAPYTPESL